MAYHLIWRDGLAQKAGEPNVAEAVETSMRKLRERAEFVVKALAG